MSKLTHFDDNGNPNMVDVSSKEITIRNAEASGFVYMQEKTLKTIKIRFPYKFDILILEIQIKLVN